MKRRTIILILFLGLVLIGYFLISPKESINHLENSRGLLTQKQIDIIYNQIKLYPNKTQLAISIIKGDSCIYYGAIKNNDTVSEIDNKYSLFEIGSITKVFTTTLLADFVVDSTLTLDRYINEDLNFKLNNNIKISYIELANHTSGLPRKPSDLFFSSTIKSPLNPYKFYNSDKLEKYLKEKLEIICEGSTKYKYSNLGVGLLGYVLCKVAQTDYETLLNEKIFIKYGLINTTSIKDNIDGELVAGLSPIGTKTPNWDLASLEACGGLISSSYDLTKFVQAQFDTNNVELALTRESTFIKENKNEMGLGWSILTDKSDNNWYFKNGGTGGYRCATVFDADNKTGIIVLTNISIGHRKSDQIDEFCYELMRSITPANI
jgi:CubicO group peptidase (beta-lactamase class C family)